MKNTIKAIGIDVGGTHIRWALVSREGEVLRQDILCHREENRDFQSVHRLSKEFSLLLREQPDVRGIGIGLPGSIDPKTGVLLKAPNLPSWVGTSISGIFQRQLGNSLTILTTNDANLYALGEGWQGAAQGVPHFLCVTLGTGVGGGLVLNGKLWEGKWDSVAEVGHMGVVVEGRPCACGRRGCLEAYVSCSAFVEQAREILEWEGASPALRRFFSESFMPGSKELAQLAETKEAPEIQELLSNMGKYLGIALGGIVNLLGLEAVVIGGGLSGSFHLFKDGLVKHLKEQVFSEKAQNVAILKAALGQFAGPIGGAKWVFDHFGGLD
ncbi:MAG: ROK family protein [Deltaproteobacteria bacterium]|nr:ROK family protein [Deltaproteobacteria bacterium]